MSRLGKTIISLLSAGLVAVAGILLYVFWPAITGTINENKYYTAEDVQKSYDKGFDDGNKSETELTAEITYYKTLVDEYEIEVSSLNKEISDLIALRNQNEITINELTSIRDDNQSTIDRLQTTVDKNNENIENYQTKISEMTNQIKNLQNSNTNNQAEINNLRNQISNYQTMINQLQNTNDMNIQTINTLNSQIAFLNTQISELQFELNNNSGSVDELKTTIAELQKSITYYESYIAELESDSQVVATFEFDGSVYNIQIINKGSSVSVIEPTSSEKVIFNGWTVNGVFVDLSKYQVTTNTKFVADITYKNVAVFKSNGETIKEEYVLDGNYAVAPIVSREGYEFDGWTVDGKNIVNIASYEITKDTTFTAVYTRIHTVTFVYEDEIISTQNIRNGEYSNNVNVDNTVYKQFNGWTVNGSIVDVSNYKISSSVVFTASIIYSYDVNFIVDNEVYNSQIVVQNNYVSVPNIPEKKDYIFDGWTINGSIVDLTTYRIINNTTIIATFTYAPAGLFADDGSLIMTWDDMVENNYVTFTDGVVSQGTNSDRTTMTGYLKMPEEVTSISNSSSSSNSPFYQCTGLTGVEFSENITLIGKYAFYGCSGLNKIVVPKSVFSLENYAFTGCSITELYIPNLSNWCISAFTSYTDNPMYQSKSFYYLDGDVYKFIDTEFTIPSNITTIKQCAFSNLPLIKLTIPNTVTSMNGAAFSYCNKVLEYLDVPSFEFWCNSMGSITSTNEISYHLNYYLKSLCVDGNSVSEISQEEFDSWILNTTVIPRYTFTGCNNLTELIFPTNIKTIRGKAFIDCNNVTKIVVPSSVTSIEVMAFDVPNLTDIEIPFVGTSPTATASASQTCFGAIFSVNYDCTTITQRYGSTSGKSRTSYIPSNLKTVTITGGNKLFIGAFYGCSMIENVTIPESITRINNEAFYGCTGLKTVYFNAKNCEANDYNGIWTLCGRDSGGITVIIGKNVEVLNSYVLGSTNYSADTSVPNFKYIYFESGSKCTSISSSFQYLRHLIAIYIPSSVTSIKAYTFSFGGNFTIYCGASSKPSGYVDGWNWYNSTSTYLTVKYGYTLSVFKTAVGIA